jgi:putative endonuclease
VVVAAAVRASGKAGAWFVYVVECADGSLYTGIARDVAARLAAHEAGRGARYTRGRGPLKLLRTRRCSGHGDALRLEWAFKVLSRTEKAALLASPRKFSAFARRVAVSARSSRAR